MESLLKWEYVSSKLNCTIGLGGIVEASRRWIFVLKASGTETPKEWDLLIGSRMACIWIHGVFSDGVWLLSSESSIALRKARRSSRRKSNAWAISSDMQCLRP
jgi:hypothetical protein